jgi:Fe-Mn family superoxide dismutase
MMTRRDVLELAAAGTAVSLTPSIITAASPADPPFTLPKLPYAYDALEPYIDAQTMTIHHDKHHQTYVDNLNKAVGTDPVLSKMTVEELLQKLDTLPAAVKGPVRNSGGGHANHSLFWQTLSPAGKGGKPSGALAAAIDKSFGGQDKLEDAIKAAALGQFGSGWGWLSLDSSGKLIIDAAPNQDSPLSTGRKPILGIDVWEHAYYLKYQNRRAEYLAAIVKVINWDFVSDHYKKVAM